MRQNWIFGTAVAFVFSLGAIHCQATQQGEAESSELKNGSFEELDEAGQPTGWFFPPALKQAGYQLTIDSTNPLAGKNSALVDATSVSHVGNSFGNLMQSVDAEPYRGKRLRFRAAVRTADLVDEGRAQLWFRVDRVATGGASTIGAFDNMDDRPIRDDQWKHYEIVAQIDNDASSIKVGMLLLGTGKAWLDDVTLEVVSESTPTTGANVFVRNRSTSEQDKPQPFFNHWLWLPAIALALFGLSYSNLGLVQRIALRFSVAYWLLYSLPSPFSSLIPKYGFTWGNSYEQLVDKVVRWTAANVLGIQQTLVGRNGSGDTTFDYVRILICFALACAIAALWSAADWRRTEHPWVKDLLRSYLRYVLAFTMLGYGLAKVGSMFNQFPPPQIDQLTRTYGESSPMGLVWTFMGSSQAYTMFAGLGEVAGALLLIWRRTTMLGAAVSFGVMFNVVMINYCYDVPVKQYSTHLLVMALYILLPDLHRLANLFVWNQPVAKVDLRPPYTMRRPTLEKESEASAERFAKKESRLSVSVAHPSTTNANGLATQSKTIWIQRAIKAYMIVMGIGLPLYFTLYREFKPKESNLAAPEFYGSYDVDEFLKDGQPVPPVLTDATRWQTLTLRRFPWGRGGGPGPADYITIRMMDRSSAGGEVLLSNDNKSLVLQSGGMGTVPGELSVELLDAQHLVVSGVANGQKIEVKLHKLNREDFLLINRGYRWINEFPFNR